MEKILVFLIAAVALIAIIGFTVKKVFIDKKQMSALDWIAEYTDLIFKIGKEATQIAATNVSDFKTEDEFIDYIAKTVSDEFIEQTKNLGVYDQMHKIFTDTALQTSIKLIVVRYKEELGITTVFNKSVQEQLQKEEAAKTPIDEVVENTHKLNIKDAAAPVKGADTEAIVIAKGKTALDVTTPEPIKKDNPFGKVGSDKKKDTTDITKDIIKADEEEVDSIPEK